MNVEHVTVEQALENLLRELVDDEGFELRDILVITTQRSNGLGGVFLSWMVIWPGDRKRRK